MLGMYIIPKIIGAVGPDRLYQDGYCDASSYAIYIPRRESQIQRLRDWRIAPKRACPFRFYRKNSQHSFLV